VLNEKHGFEIYSTGKIQRELARQFGVSTLEMNQMMSKDTKYDHMIDDEVTRISIDRKDDRLLFDSRMAWHFAKNTFKVFFTIDPQIAALRVMKDPRGAEETYTGVDDAREKLILRSLVENERFKQIYGTDNLSYANYDLVVDTSYETPDNICKLIYDEYEKFCACPEQYERKMYFSPKSLYPTADKDSIAEMRPDSAGDGVEVICARNYNFIISGHEAVLNALTNGASFVCAKLPTLELAQIESKVAASSLDGMKGFERLGGFTYPSYPEI
jgi:cytidylate kinase